MSISRNLDEVHSELADEHRAIMGLVARIEGERQVEVLPPLLEQLHAVLIDHFAHEQFPGGLYERMGALAVEYHDDMKALIRDHCVILSNVRALLERSRVASPLHESELLEDVAGMTRQLHDHEHREHGLVDRIKANVAGGNRVRLPPL